MDSHTRKLIASIIVVAILIIYYLIIALALIKFKFPFFVIVIIGLFTAILSSLLIYVLAERIKEIWKGEEDDLSKY